MTLAPQRLLTLSLAEAADGLADGTFSAAELADATLRRIADADGRVNAFRFVDADGLRAAAAASDKRRAAGHPLGPLDGVPVSVKDNLMTRGVPTTCSSRMLENFVPPFDAAVVERLKAAGALPVGKTNLDEFAMGTTAEHCAWGPVRNPWDLERAAGGSSGGAAAATAYGGGLAALASDTGGSIRGPAAFCGLVGSKPTYGRVSRYGAAAMASSLDQVGVISRTVRDNALLLQAISGFDPRDGTSRDLPVPAWADDLSTSPALAGARIGWVPEWLDDPRLDPGVVKTFRAAAESFRALGAELVELSLPRIRHGVAAYYIICSSEVCANMARFDGFRYGLRGAGADWAASARKSRGDGFGREVKRRILAGAFTLSAGYRDAYYLKAARVRRLLSDDFAEALRRCEAILLPVTPCLAPRLGEWMKDPLTAYMADLFTIPANLTGYPALSFPVGTVDGLAVGAQLVTRPWDEASGFRLAHAFERRRPETTFAHHAARLKG